MIWPIFYFLTSLTPNIYIVANTLGEAHLATDAQYESSSKKVVSWSSETDHDFGDLKKDNPVEYIFKFTNIASDTILLQTVRTTCGCTAATWTETPIAPGKEGIVTIEYDAYQGGDFSKKIRVFFDKQRKPEILRIRGTVN